MENNNDRLSRFWFLASNALPPIGILLYLKHRRQYPNKARKALTSALIGIPVAFAAGYVFNNFIIK